MITRKNYEEYFLDYFDGNLSDELVEGLLRFLAANSDLEEEFYLLMEQTADCNITSVDFSNITVKRDPKMGYELSSFDYLCVAEIEHDITPNEKAILSSSIVANSKLKSDFENFKKTKLEEEEIKCPFKNELKKNVFTSQLKRNLITYSSIAAAVLIVFYFTINEETVKEISDSNNKEMVVKPQNTNDAIKQLVAKPLVADQIEHPYSSKVKSLKSQVNSDLPTNDKILDQSKKMENVDRQLNQIAYIASNNTVKVEGIANSLSNKITESNQLAFKQVANANNIGKNDTEIASAVSSFLENAKMETETFSQNIKEIRGRRKGVFIARAINGLNSILGTNIEYSSKYDAEGNLVAMNLEAGLIKYSKKNDELK